MARASRAVKPRVPSVKSRRSRVPASFAALTALVLVTTEPVHVQSVAPVSAPTGQGTVARLPPADAVRDARDIRSKASIQLAPGLEIAVWAPEGLVADPMAIDIDPRGVAYVTSSPRSGQLLDIRQHPDWVPDVHTLKTVEDLRQFFRRVMAPDRSGSNGWLPDYNGDGSR